MDVRERLTVAQCLPVDTPQAMLIGRVWSPAVAGPIVAVVRADALYDLARLPPTVRDLMELDDLVVAIRQIGSLPRIGDLAAILANSSERDRDNDAPWLLAPCDLQAIKASGVTFVSSMLERVIEEQARGNASKAESVRRSITSVIGDNLSGIKPGSPEALRLKEVMIGEGVWSQYLEVGIGPDA